MPDLEFLALMATVCIGFAGTIYQNLTAKDDSAAVRVEIAETKAEVRELRAEIREEFAKCHSHPISKCIEEENKNE